MSAATYLDRMRANAAQALAEGATLPELLSHVLTVTRKVSRPGQAEADDATEVAELVDVLNEFRTGVPS